MNTIPGESVCTHTVPGVGATSYPGTCRNCVRWASIPTSKRAALRRLMESEAGMRSGARQMLEVGAAHALGELLHQRVRPLGQAAFRRAVRHVARRPTTLHARADSLEYVPLDARLLTHNVHGDLRTEQQSDEVDVHDSLNRLDRDGRKRPPGSDGGITTESAEQVYPWAAQRHLRPRLPPLMPALFTQ